MSKNYTIPANTDWITLAALMGEDYDSTQYYVIHVNEITNGLLQYTCRLDMPTNEDIGQQFSNFSTIKVGTDVGDYTFLKATDTPIDVEVFIGSEDEPSPTPTPTPTGGVIPKNIAGLVMCLDGEINSRAGVHDESINGMQNLVYAPIVGNANTTGCIEKLNGTATFSDKGIKLGGTCFYPLYQQVALTFEFTGSFDTYPFNNYGKCQRFIQTVYNGGYQIHLNNNDLVYESYNSSGARIKYITFPMIYELGKPIHFTITDVLNVSGSTKFYINGEEVQPVFNADGTTSVCATSSTNMGIMGIHSRSAESVYPFTHHQEGSFEGEYTYVNAIRLWNRVLSPEEIKQNYLQDKKRFG